MKNNVDRLYDRITGNMIRQRRLISILLVLSILVSSGVLWGLRDTGISMANDAECGIEEHIHTDECYGDILVCGYDDDGELAEDEVEYQYVRTCGLEESDEHTHDMDCFGFVYAAGERNDAAADGAVAADEIAADAEETGEEIQGTEEAVSEGIDASEDAVKHVHTEECYARGVICGKEEHDHVYSCYFGDVPEEEEDFGLFDDSKVVMLNNTTDDEDIEFFDASEMMVGAESELPKTISTIDNIAEGIKFTLFDYYDSDGSLENTGTYDISWRPVKKDTNEIYTYNEWNKLGEEVKDSEFEWRWVHNDIKYTGLNTGRNAADDILFFKYGTPAFTGTFNSLGNNVNGYGPNEGINIYTRISPDKNNLSGDYNFYTDYPAGTDLTDKKDKWFSQTHNNSYLYPISQNRPVQGIVYNKLVGGYPAIAKYNTDSNGNKVLDTTNSGNSLAYLFDPDTKSDHGVNLSDVRVVYQNVNHILKEKNLYGDRHLVYDSNDNYAYFNQDTNDFSVYEKTFNLKNSSHEESEEFKIGFFPFDQYDESRKDPNFDGDGYNHHFGMTMSAAFSNPVNRNDTDPPIIFSYSGDDDMWVFVDGVLVLDVGGIHEPAAGMIDFTNGFVWVQDNYLGKTETDLKSDLGDLFEKCAKPKNYYTTSDNDVKIYNSNNKWKIKTISECFNEAGENWNPEGVHSINMFYLERGGCYSNLAMDMNLPTLKNLIVSKAVDKDDSIEKDASIDNAEYKFRVLEKDSNGVFVPANLGNGISNEFILKAGGRMIFENLDSFKEYRVEEYNIDTGVYSSVILNTNEYKNQTVVSNGSHTLNDVNVYNFTNVVRREFKPITVEKEWVELSESTNHPDSIKFKLYRKDITDDSVEKTVVYDKSRTFSLDADKEWKRSFDLPVRYGSHIYEYSVKEMSVPNGYSVSYGTDENTGNLMIINTNDSRTDIYAKKEWENIDSTNVQSVKLELKREYVEYTGSLPTNLTVKVYDTNGALLAQDTRNDVYVGGSAEVYVGVPNGTSYLRDRTQKSPNTLQFNDSDAEDGFFEISNLSDGNNEVKIFVDYSSFVLIHHSFTNDKCGWAPSGINNNDFGTSNNQPYATGNALYIKNMDNRYDGVQLYLDKEIFKSGDTYTFIVYLRCHNADTGFQFVFYDGGDNGWHNINSQWEKIGIANQWKQFKVTYTLPQIIDPERMYLKIQCSTDGGAPSAENNSNVNFRMDEFVALRGSSENVSVDTNGRIVIPVYGQSVYYRHESEFNTLRTNVDRNKWKSKGNSKVETQNTTNDGNYVLVDNRTSNSDGAQLSGSDLDMKAGNSYSVIATVLKHKNGSPTYHITMRNGSEYNWISSSVQCSTWDPVTLSADFTIPLDTDISNIDIIVESEGEDTIPFRIYSCELFDTTQVLNEWQSHGGNSEIHVRGKDSRVYLLNDNRSGSWNGLKMKLDSSKVIPGRSYLVKAEVGNDNSDDSTNYKLTFVNGSKYNQVKDSGTITGNGISEISKVFKIPDDADLDDMYFLVETDSGTEPFRLYGFEITPYNGDILPDGFVLDGNNLVLDTSSLFEATLDKDSFTNPPHISGVYQPDKNFGNNGIRYVTLNKDNKWEVHLGTQENGEFKLDEQNSGENKQLYKYYIDEIEVKFIDETGNVKTLTKADLSTYFDVVYSNYSDDDGVSTNTEKTPVTIHNKYIWYRLPATGGHGTTIYFIGGIAFILLGITGAVIINRRRSKNT